MAVINVSVTAAGIRAEFQEKFSAAEGSALWPSVCTTLQSDKDKESYGFLGSVAPMKLWGQGRKAQPLFDEKYDVKNEKYETTIEVDRDTLADDQVGALRLRISEMAARAATFRDALLVNLLLNGNQSGFNSYDGVPFFGTNHASGKSGTQSNSITLDVSDHTKPTGSDIRTALTNGMVTLMGLKDDQAEPMNPSTSGLVLVVAPGAYIPALEAVSSTLTSSAAVNVLQGAARVFAFARLTNQAIMFLLQPAVGIRPFIHQLREEIEFSQLAEGSSEEFLREKYYFGTRGRFALTFGMWQRAVRIELT